MYYRTVHTVQPRTHTTTVRRALADALDKFLLSGNPATNAEIAGQFGVHTRTVRKRRKRLRDQGLLAPGTDPEKLTVQGDAEEIRFTGLETTNPLDPTDTEGGAFTKVFELAGVDPADYRLVADSFKFSTWQQSKASNDGARDLVQLYSYRGTFQKRNHAIADELQRRLEQALQPTPPTMLGICGAPGHANTTAHTPSGDPLIVNLADLQLGKGLSSSTPIFTPRGWTTHGRLDVGDYVFGADGHPKKVTYVHETTVRSLYRVTFGDGTYIDCDDQHLWTGRRKYHNLTGVGNAWEWRDMTLSMSELLDMYSQSKKTIAVRPFVVPQAEPLELPEQDLPIDPYILGVWLGDGSSHSGHVTKGVADKDWLLELGTEVPSNSKDGTFGVLIPGLHSKLRELNLLRNKHIPDIYLRASYNQRLALLQGLMDTDGTAYDSGACSFSNTNMSVSEGLTFLVRSLGMDARVREGVGKLYGVEKRPFRETYFRANCQVFRLTRKRNLVRDATERRDIYRSIRSIERLDDGEAQCISVEGSLYLAGHQLKVTHNCDTLGGIAELQERFDRLLGEIVALAAAERPREIVIADVGDICENVANNTSVDQASTNDLTLSEQMEWANRLVAQSIISLQPYTPKLTVLGVPSNHGADKLPNGKQNGHGDWGLTNILTLKNAFTALRPEWGIEFKVPEPYEVGVAHEVEGCTIVWVHGHLAGSADKMAQWLANQAANPGTIYARCAALFFGHFHRFSVLSSRGRDILGCPTLDSGSSWFTNRTGEWSRPGILTTRVRDGRVSGIRIFEA